MHIGGWGPQGATCHASHIVQQGTPVISQTPGPRNPSAPTRRRQYSPPVPCAVVQGLGSGVSQAPARSHSTPQPVALNPPAQIQLQLHRPSINQEAANRVTALIQQCTDWDQLQTLFEQQQGRLNSHNLLALMTCLTTVTRVKKMVRFEDSKARAFVSSVVESLLHEAGQLDVQGVASCLWALGKLRMHPGIVSINQLLSLAHASFTTQHILPATAMSDLIWSLARLKHCPDHDWMSSFLEATTSCLHRMPPKSLANTIWAVASLKVQPQLLHTFMPVFLQASEASLIQHEPQGLCNTCWALSRLGCQPDALWMSSFWSASALQAAQGALNPIDLGQLLAAAAKFKKHSQPPDSWLQDVLNGTAASQEKVGKQELVMCLTSLVWLHAEPVEWIKQLLDRGHGSVKDMGAQEVSNLVWALAHFPRTPVRRSFIRDWFRASFNAMPYLNAQDCSQLVWSVGVLGWHPPPDWIAALHEESFKRLPYFNSAQCTALMRGLRDLDAWPSKLWMERFYLDTVQLLPTFKNMELCILLVALGTCPTGPPHQWLAQWLLTTQPRLTSFTAQELVKALHALHSMGRQADDTWLMTFMHVVSQSARATHAAMGARGHNSQGSIDESDRNSSSLSRSGRSESVGELVGESVGSSLSRQSLDGGEWQPGLASSARRRQVRAMKHAGSFNESAQVSGVVLSRKQVYVLLRLLPSFQVEAPPELLALGQALGCGEAVDKGGRAPGAPTQPFQPARRSTSPSGSGGNARVRQPRKLDRPADRAMF